MPIGQQQTLFFVENWPWNCDAWWFSEILLWRKYVDGLVMVNGSHICLKKIFHRFLTLTSAFSAQFDQNRKVETINLTAYIFFEIFIEAKKLLTSYQKGWSTFPAAIVHWMWFYGNVFSIDMLFGPPLSSATLFN